MAERQTAGNKKSAKRVAKKTLPAEPDYNREGREIDIPLLRALALGRKSSAEIQLLLDSELERSASKSGVLNNSQVLALLLADLSVPEDKASATFKRLISHRERMTHALGRAVGIKTAAMDYLEHLERALKIRETDGELTYSQLTQMAFTDQLTGLANYRFFTQRMREEARRCERYGHLLSLLMMDIDHFKQFNDRFGHPAGNKALQQITRALFAEVRDTDLLARYGGEEFALILPHTSKLEATVLAERIRNRVAETKIMSEGRVLDRLTISLGLATLPRDAREVEALISAADQALYQAKQSGRNRFRVYEPETIGRFRYVPGPKEKISSVSIISDFNDWKAGVDVLKSNARGVFELDVPLAPGQYRYKLVLNEKEFVPDPLSKENEPDSIGGVNSVLSVKED